MKYKRLTWTILLLLIFSSFAHAEHAMYVVAGAKNKLLTIDTQSDKITDVIIELVNAYGLAGNSNTEFLITGSFYPNNKYLRDQKKIYIEDAGKSFVSVIHPKHGYVMREIRVRGLTDHLNISPSGKFAVAVHGKENGVTIINLDKSQVVTFVTTAMAPKYAIFSSDGKKLFVSNSGSSSVSVIGTKTWEVIKNIRVGSGPGQLHIDSYNEVLYVANVLGNSISVVNLADPENVHTIKVGKAPHGISLSSDGLRLFVSNEGSNSLTRINIDNGEVKNLTLIPSPYHLEVIPNTGKLYVSSRTQPIIWVIDQTSLHILKKITISSGIAQQMIVLDR